MAPYKFQDSPGFAIEITSVWLSGPLTFNSLLRHCKLEFVWLLYWSIAIKD